MSEDKTYIIFGYKKYNGNAKALIQIGKVKANDTRTARKKMNKKFPKRTTSLVEKKNVRYKDR